jgi:hypothetical protein
MREKCEFRVNSEFAHLLFAEGEGKDLGMVRKVVLPVDDPRFSQIGQLQKQLRKEADRAFFFFWRYHRTYSRQEIEQAPLFRLWLQPVFEPAGEECGTLYDASTGCSKCGAGATQQLPLRFDSRRIPKNAEIAQTIANEIVVSARLAEDLRKWKISGIELVQAIDGASASSNWHQLIVQNTMKAGRDCRFGIDPFDDDPDGYHRCPESSYGHVAGLNLLSEVSIECEGQPLTDVVLTDCFVGTRRGLLRPYRILLISARLRRFLLERRLKSQYEVAHLLQ